jgi:hypothetical protein
VSAGKRPCTNQEKLLLKLSQSARAAEQDQALAWLINKIADAIPRGRIEAKSNRLRLDKTN